jgi:hypothetical protein
MVTDQNSVVTLSAGQTIETTTKLKVVVDHIIFFLSLFQNGGNSLHFNDIDHSVPCHPTQHNDVK